MANITFGSNAVVNGTNNNDVMTGTQPGGNVNDLVYGHQGNDTIQFQTSVSNSTMFGGQGDDDIIARNGKNNVIYGNLGDDTIVLRNDTGDKAFGGMGNDAIYAIRTKSSAVYGNQGNDFIYGFNDQSTKMFGGKGDDTIVDRRSISDAIYGNQGNDLLLAGGPNGIVDSHEYGGQGNDTLVFTGTGGGRTTNDAETGGVADDLFVASNDTGGSSLNANDIVTVTDFLQGSDHLALTANTSTIPLAKIDGMGASALQALNLANSAYASHPGREYVFVYGGTGAGYLFYNGNSNSSTLARAGMALTGATGESSVNSPDIVTFTPGLDNL
jgi:Ca2+-binding RTX toxin-like protein